LYHVVSQSYISFVLFVTSGSTGSWPTSTFTTSRPDNVRYVPGRHHRSKPSSSSGSLSWSQARYL